MTMTPMRVRLTVRAGLVVLTLGTPLSILRADARQDAQDAWAHRAEPNQLTRAITLWQDALKQSPNDGTILTALARALGKSYRSASSKKDRIQLSDQALTYAEQAIAKSPSSSAAYAAYGEALGQWADARKNLKGLKRVKQAVAALQKAVELDSNNHFAHMLLAQFYRKAPANISVGDKKKALEEARKAVETGPGYAINHLVLAESLLDQGQRDEAIREFRAILALTPPADAIPETRGDQETARTRLRELNASSNENSSSSSVGSEQAACESHGGHWSAAPTNACTQP